MISASAERYNFHVTVHRWQQAAALLLTFAFIGLAQTSASADTTTRVVAGPSPVFFVQLDQGSVVLRTTNQPAVQIESNSPVQIRHIAAQSVGERLPVQVMLWSERIHTPAGDLSLPPEAFIFPNLNGAPHDAVIIRGSGNVTISAPDGTALFVGNVRRGTVEIQDYKNGVFVAHVGAGSVSLDDVSGTGAVQVNNGGVLASNSDFLRLRVRTGRGNMRFQNCNSTQIEATSLTGSILYDNGSFRPGLARFETDRGDVILGIAGSGVQIGAHSSAGRIFSDAGTRAGTTDQQVIFGHGGPVVTATSSSGAIIFYNGALRDHPDLQRRAALRSLVAPIYRMTRQPFQRRLPRRLQ